MQSAIARREMLPRAVSAAIAEVGSAEACLTLIENVSADIAEFSLVRIVQRFGHLAAIREALLAWADLPAAIRHALVVKLSETLAGFVVARHWMEEGRAQRIAQEACEKATVILAALEFDVSPLVGHLRETGQLTAGLVLRSLLSGNIDFFEQALAELAGAAGVARQRTAARPPRGRLQGGLRARGPAGFGLSGVPRRDRGNARRRLRRAGRHHAAQAPHGRARADKLRRMPAGDVEPLMTLLRRYATEAAREEARLFCDELVEMGNHPVPANDTGRMVVAA